MDTVCVCVCGASVCDAAVPWKCSILSPITVRKRWPRAESSRARSAEAMRQIFRRSLVKHQLTSLLIKHIPPSQTPPTKSLFFFKLPLCLFMLTPGCEFTAAAPSAAHHILFFFLNKCNKSSHLSHCQLTPEKQENCHPFSQFLCHHLLHCVTMRVCVTL